MDDPDVERRAISVLLEASVAQRGREPVGKTQVPRTQPPKEKPESPTLI